VYPAGGVFAHRPHRAADGADTNTNGGTCNARANTNNSSTDTRRCRRVDDVARRSMFHSDASVNSGIPNRVHSRANPCTVNSRARR